MKRLIIFITALFFIISCGNNEKSVKKNNTDKTGNNNSFTINGTLTDGSSGTVYLSKVIDGNLVPSDSAMAKNGKFTFKGTIDEPEMLYVQIKDKRGYGRLFVEPSDITLEIDPANIQSLKVSGSTANDIFNKFQKGSESFENKLNDIWQQMQKAKQSGDNKTYDILGNKLDSIDKLRQNFAIDYAKKNYNSIVSAFIVYLNSYSYDENDLEPLLNTFTPEVKNSSYGKELQKRVDILKKVSLGKKAIDFTMNDTQGNPVTLSSLFGKYLLIDFWASWCSPCRKENPNLVKTYNKFKNKGFDILGVSFDKQKQNWLEAIKEDNLTWHHVSDLKGWKNAAGELYGIRSIPSNVLLNPEGIIIAKNLRGDDLNKKLTEIFNN